MQYKEFDGAKYYQHSTSKLSDKQILVLGVIVLAGFLVFSFVVLGAIGCTPDICY